jgi:hypothetical protein
LPPREPDRATQLALLVPAALAGALVWLATRGFGPGLSPDSVQFLAAAKSLALGHGWQRVEGTPLVEWAPLLPLWLALGAKLGMAPLVLARLTGAFSAAGVAWATGLWGVRATGQRGPGLGAGFAVALSFPLLYVSAHLWSDAPFLFLALLGILALGDTRPVFLAALWAALACLTRYLGVTLVLAGAVSLLASRRVKDAIVYSVLAGAPLALWLARNALVSGTATGLREPPGFTWAENLLAFLHGAIDPILPWSWPGAIKLGLVALLAFGGWALLRGAPRRGAGPLALFVFLYAVAVVVVSAFWGADPADIRLALPLAVALLAGACVAATRVGSRSLQVVLVLVAAAWLGRSAVREREQVALYQKQGVPGFGDQAWRASPTLARLRSAPPSPPVYSNAPEIAWLALESPVRLSPRAHLYYSEAARVNDLPVFVAEVRRSSRASLVWFREVNRPSLIGRDTLAGHVTLRPLAELPDGIVDEVSP